MNILLIAPSYMLIYRDIVTEMMRRGWHVDFIAETYDRRDPNNVQLRYDKLRHALLVHPERWERKNRRRWETTLSNTPYNKTYDILLVVNGQGFHPCIVDILRKRNPRLQTVNYLFDTVRGVYQFNHNFAYFDHIATFDHTESQQFNITFLPNFWTPCIQHQNTTYRFFGLGKHDMLRLQLFRKIAEITQHDTKPSYIQIIIDPPVKFYSLRMLLRRLTGRPYVSINDYRCELSTTESIPPEEYKRLIADSDIVIDTAAQWQDGLTPRFMWALGANKKIITTNSSARQYTFYSPEQIYIVDDISRLYECDNFKRFLNTTPHTTPEMQADIDQYRIDNWIDTLLTQK